MQLDRYISVSNLSSKMSLTTLSSFLALSTYIQNVYKIKPTGVTNCNFLPLYNLLILPSVFPV